MGSVLDPGRELGEGADGKVYSARYRHHACGAAAAVAPLRYPHVVKVVKHRSGGLAEAAAMAAVTAAAVATTGKLPRGVMCLTDVLPCDGSDSVGLVMKRAVGGSLRKFMFACNELHRTHPAVAGALTSPASLATVCRGVVDGVAEMHAAGVAHNDLKVDNVLVVGAGAADDDEEGEGEDEDPSEVADSDPTAFYARLSPTDAVALRVRVGDLGRATMAAAAGGAVVAPVVVGTVAYMAPEAVAAMPHPTTVIDHCAADVWSLGYLLAMLLLFRGEPFDVRAAKDKVASAADIAAVSKQLAAAWTHPFVMSAPESYIDAAAADGSLGMSAAAAAAVRRQWEATADAIIADAAAVNVAVTLPSVTVGADPAAIHLVLGCMLVPDPALRATMPEVLRHPWYTAGVAAKPPPSSPAFASPPAAVPPPTPTTAVAAGMSDGSTTPPRLHVLAVAAACPPSAPRGAEARGGAGGGGGGGASGWVHSGAVHLSALAGCKRGRGVAAEMAALPRLRSGVVVPPAPVPVPVTVDRRKRACR